MKKQTSALRKLIFSLVVLFAGVQGVFAALDCEGTIYLKLPDGWKSAYAVAAGQKVRFTASTEFDGWLQLSASQVGGTNNATGFNINESSSDACNEIGHCISPTLMDSSYMQISDTRGFNCTDFGKTGELWISANPDPAKPTKPYFSSTPPDVKYFYVFLPNDVAWKSSVAMLSVDGKAGEAMTADPERCGWFYKRYVDEEPPSSVLIYRDDDETMKEAIGLNGDWEETDTPTPIDLKMMFEFLASDNLYFVAAGEYADETNPESVGWTTIDPGVTGDCAYDLAALIYDTDASLHGAFTCNPDWTKEQTEAQAKANACYYPSAPYNVVSSATGVVPCIGVTKGMVTDVLDKNTKKPVLTDIGRRCFGSTPDDAFTAMFNSTPGVNETYCFDLPFSRTDDGKYEFDSDNYTSPGATVAGGFYPAEEEPPASKMMSDRLPEAEYKRKAEGPVFFCPDYDNQKSTTPEGLRTIDPTEGVPVSDLMCKGPGWKGGVDCDGLFTGGSEFANDDALTGTGTSISRALSVSWKGDGWGWACQSMAPVGWTYYKEGTETVVGTLKSKNQVPTGGYYRWTSGTSDSDVFTNKGRNQHFCFESHANFRYKKGLRFSFRGDDDIWVYIDNKLAVDLGGTHLAAPGYVDLDLFMGSTAIVGQTYDIDIFFCDRRTTMSNVRIKTNMFIQQTSGLKKDIISKAGGVEDYKLKYCVTGDGSCGSLAGSGASKCYEGGDLCTYLNAEGKTVNYSITNKKGDQIIKAEEELAQSIVYLGGIDLTDRCDPKIDKNTLGGLPPNTYYLVAKVDGKTEKIQFKVQGTLEVANKPGYAQDDDGNRLPGTYEITKLALASIADNPTRIPLYVSSMMDQGDSLLFDISSAPGQAYTLSVIDASTNQAAKDVTLEVKDATGAFVSWDPSTTHYVGDGGVDTIYASVPMSFLQRSEQTYYVSVTGRSLVDTITFFAPTLVYVTDSSSTTQITGDPETEEKWTGSLYNFYILALAPSTSTPGTYEPCDDRCNFMLDVGINTSQGVQVDSIGRQLVNGRATISVYCTKEYRAAGNGQAANPAKLSIVGPNKLIVADYSPLYFRNPPVPYPLFADMFDVRGKKPALQMVIDDPYFSMEQDYLDGIADSLVIYYNREFYKSPDSLPTRIVVLWEGEGKEDSVVVPKEAFQNNMACGAEYGLADTLCLGRISVSGVEFSKEVKTSSPTATVVSFATFMDRGKSTTESFTGPINDRVAPVIKSASVYSLNDEWNKMTIELSEEVQINSEFLKKGFSVFLNSATNLSGSEKYIVALESPSEMGVGGDKVTIQFPSSSDKGLSPHTGDYVRFRADVPVWTDMAVDAALTDPALRPADDASYSWNAPTDYNSTVRLPSPWAPVTGEAETGVKSKVYTQVPLDTIPTSITTVKAYPITDNFEAVEKDNPGVLGYFLMSDMYSLVYSDSSISNYFTSPAHSSEVGDIYLEYELDVFTNLGGFVAHESKKVRCNDEDIFGEGHNCLDTQRNFFISWNTIASDGRLVGTGAFVSKIKSSVRLGNRGTRAKMDKTKMWGVRRDKGFKGHVVND